jgi:hypothetical protein
VKCEMWIAALHCVQIAVGTLVMTVLKAEN